MDDDERRPTPISEASNAEEAPGAILPVHNDGQYGSTLVFPPGPPLPYDFTTEIAGLDEVPKALAKRIQGWICEVLGSVQQDRSYGTILKFRRGQVGQVCVVFGFPEPKRFDKHGEVPDGMPCSSGRIGSSIRATVLGGTEFQQQVGENTFARRLVGPEGGYDRGGEFWRLVSRNKAGTGMSH